MANPLSEHGISDRDYAAAVGTLMGEGLGQGTLGYAAIADVIANRMQDPRAYGARVGTISAVAMNPSEFQAWNGKDPRAQGGYKNAKNGFAAALNANLAEKFGLTEELSKVNEALVGVFGTGQLRGLTQGATFYQEPKAVAAWGTGGYQDRLADRYGSVMIGDHRFTGPGFRPDQPFDPLTYNGQLGIPETAEAFLGDLGIPTGNIEFAGAVPDLSPSFVGPIDPTMPDFSDVYSPDILGGPTRVAGMGSFAPAGAFSRDPLGDLRGFTSPDAAALFSGQPMGPAQSFGFGGLGGLGGFNAPGMIDQAGFESRWSGGYPASMVHMGYPETDIGIVSPGALGFGSQFGIETSSWDPSGYAAGFDAGPWGNIPDHSAPSLEARNNFDRQMGRVEGWNGGAWNSSDLNADAIADRVNAELGRPQTRTETYTQMQPRTREVMEQVDVPYDMQAAYAGDWADKIGVERSFAPQQKTVARTVTEMVPVQKTRTVDVPSLPAPVDLGAPPSIAGPDYGSLVDTTYGMGQPLGNFMDAMANPMAASDYVPGTMMSTDPFMDAMANPTLAGQFSPGWRDGWTGNALTGAGWGLLTSGVPGALVGGVVGALNPFGRVSAHLSNSFGSNPGYAGSGRYGDTFSNARGFVDPGGWSLSNLNAATLAALASGSIYGQHPSTMGSMLGLDGIRSDGRGTGDTGYGGGTLGDGSYSSESGRNDNNPQGII